MSWDNIVTEGQYSFTTESRKSAPKTMVRKLAASGEHAIVRKLNEEVSHASTTSLMRCEITEVTPLSRMATPYSASAISIVRF